MSDLTLEKFDQLTAKEQYRLAQKALAWFCVENTFNPYLSFSAPDEVAVIKIVLSKFRGGYLS